MKNTKLAILIATYRREDGRSKSYLRRSLQSVKNQTYSDYKVFLIGDKYETPSEVLETIEELGIENIEFENLSEAKERSKYTGDNLWFYGGVNALNYGIKKAISEGFEYICHLDHDDWWYDNHLDLINQCINETESDWMCTKSTYMDPDRFLPRIYTENKYFHILPRESSLIHSSVCMNFKSIPLFYRDIYEETGHVGLPTDADLWERCRDYINENNLKSTMINELTCRHDEEGYEKSKKIKISGDSIEITNHIISNMEGGSFHNHYHILYDIALSMDVEEITYLEIGTYAGGSSSLMSKNKKVSKIYSIDTGYPVDKEVAIRNVNFFKHEKCSYEYILGNSRSQSTVDYVFSSVASVDIFFIDGDHSYDAVVNDFFKYKDLVKSGGYIIFDDYLDSMYSPEVFEAVNDIVSQIGDIEYEIIGSLNYDLIKKTNLPDFISSNEFILRKK